MGRRRWAAAGAALLAAGVVLAVALTRGGKAKAHSAPRADPLARYVPPDGRFVSASAQDEKSGGTFSKPSAAKLRRLFAVPPGAGPAAMQEAIDAATASGWTMEPAGGRPRLGRRKQLSTGRGHDRRSPCSPTPRAASRQVSRPPS